MYHRCLFLFSFLVLLLTTALADAEMREAFDTLEAWNPRTLASGLIMNEPFNPYETPLPSWRWRVENVLQKGDATRKAGDDYPLRVYVLFTYDPEKASFGMRAKVAVAKALYGETPPHASLNYLWANRTHKKRILPSPYTDRSQLIVLRTGEAEAGQWVEEEANILDDYRTAFDEDPPDEARLAVMSDADNTGGSATAFLDFIEIEKNHNE
ncbi:MAG: hypothetical protein PWQ89_261 [Verrucomicrobiota bacterium]|nr:hypothetical protein [Verrucomicrobiota bacterium]